MADTQVLGTCVFGRAGSSPASRTYTPQKAPDCFDQNLKGLPNGRKSHGRNSHKYLACLQGDCWNTCG